MTHDHSKDITSTVAKTDDGGVQINFTIPQELITHAKEHALEEYSKTVSVPGFRKGKAPIDKVEQSIAPDKLLEKTLMQILPEAFGQAIVEHKLKPALYPKFEVISQNPWQVRAVTCEIPPFELGDYKKIIDGVVSSSSLWTPTQTEKKVEPTREELEQKVFMTLLDSIKINLPGMLVEEEINVRLAQLLERIEKLGLTLDGYLSSINKTVESLKSEYKIQVTQAITLELILNKMADEQKIVIADNEVNQVLKMTNPKEKPIDPAHRHAIASILRRRAVLDRLIGTR